MYRKISFPYKSKVMHHISLVHIKFATNRSTPKVMLPCALVGTHTKKTNQLWHVGRVGAFRSSVVINQKRKIGVVVLGNSKGLVSANVHYLAKMLYNEMKINKINFQKTKQAGN